MKIYPSYWHMKVKSLITKEMSCATEDGVHIKQYLAAQPNQGAGIGHQIANWIAGYWYAEKYGLHFAHMRFSNRGWENFLGFYRNEIPLDYLLTNGYRLVRLPQFNENTEEEKTVRDIVSSYAGKKVAFLLEQDQFYKDQYGVLGEIQKKFYSAPMRKGQRIQYCSKNYNIAIHVRRGDIVQRGAISNPNLAMRFQSNDYFVGALQTAITYLTEKKHISKDRIHIYFFSQGKPEEYPEFAKMRNVHFCLDMGAKESFLHMVYADALITSKSSFSYKPALLNKGIKFCPADFWHGYPDKDDWILLDEKGNIQIRNIQ